MRCNFHPVSFVFVSNTRAVHKLLVVLISFFAAALCQAQVVEGVVSDPEGQGLPFAGVYVKDSTYGISTDRNGRFSLVLDPGQHVLVVTYVGFKPYESEVSLVRGERVLVQIQLERSTQVMGAAEVVADPKDKAKEIMKKVRDARKTFNANIQNWACSTYTQTSLMREPKDPLDPAIALLPDSTLEAAGIEVLRPEHVSLSEIVTQTHYRSPQRFQELVTAVNEYNGGEIHTQAMRSISMGAGIEFGEEDIIPEQDESQDPYLLYDDIFSCNFDFYSSTFDYPDLVGKALTSPIGTGSAVAYTYLYEGVLFEEGKAIHKIAVRPVLSGEPLFEGTLFIADSSFALVAADLRIAPLALKIAKDFHIVQNYKEVEPGVWVPVRREIQYTIRDGKWNVKGHASVEHSDFVVNSSDSPGFAPTEMKRYLPEAFDRDSTYWADRRPATLRKEDVVFIQHSDSVKAWYESDTWKHRQDSAFNIVDIWTPLVGYGYRNHKKGIELYVEGLLAQVNPFGVGGYRHRLPARVQKRFDNDFLLETEGFADYGFKNKDFKGKASLGLTYVPLKFVRTKVRFGDYYDMINDYASFSQTFSRSNYVRTTEYGIDQRMEIVNGLFAELSLTFSDQRTIEGLELSNWSGELFGDLNSPVDFERYKRAEVSLFMKYNIRQKYQIKKGRKLILGTDFPQLNLTYRKGVPGLFGSEVNYDYLEIGATDTWDLARLGTSRWKVQMGTYLNKKDLRILEHKYFRGSDPGFFSDPLRSFQLLGPTLHSPNEWFQANYIHHFEGTLLGKVPLIKRTRLMLAGGGGVLTIPDDGVYHAELFAGVERVIRIKRELFRFAFYAVTADNTLGSPDLTFKWGISFYDPFKRKWDY